jgi:hypothetical protein
MKPFLTILIILVASLGRGVAAPAPAKGSMLTDLNVIPTRVLQRSISPKFYRSLLISPVEGWIIVRAQLSNARLVGPKVVRSELKGVFDSLALQLANEAVIAKADTIESPNRKNSVLLHVLVYEIKDATMVLSFAYLDEPGGDQLDYAGCARLLILKGGKWSEIQGPESLAGKGWAVRQSVKNNFEASLRVWMRAGAEGINGGSTH